MERIAMSQQERDRLEWLKQARDKRLTQSAVAVRMGVSERGVRKMIKELATVGDAVVVHGLRGKASNRKLPETIQAQAMALLLQPEWHDFGPTYASQQLAKQGVNVSDETLRRWMTGAGIWKPNVIDPQTSAGFLRDDDHAGGGWHEKDSSVESAAILARIGGKRGGGGPVGTW